MVNEYAEDFLNTCKDVIAMTLTKNGDVSKESLDKMYGSNKINSIIHDAADGYTSGLSYDDQMAVIVSDPKSGKYMGVEGLKESIADYISHFNSYPKNASDFIEGIASYRLENYAGSVLIKGSNEHNNDIIAKAGGKA